MMSDVTWINRDGEVDDEFYQATLKILDVCRSAGVSMVGVVCDRHQTFDVDAVTSGTVAITALCTLEDSRLMEPLAEAASENVAELIIKHNNNGDDDDHA